MLITVNCKCGKSFKVGEALVGETVHCTGCSKPVLVTRPGARSSGALKKPVLPPPPPLYDDEVRPSARPPAESLPADEEAVRPPRAPAPSLRDYAYWLLALALFPLAVDLGQPPPEPVETIIERSIPDPDDKDRARRILEGYEYGDLDDILAMTPERRLAGAAFPRDTSIHWLFALATSVIFAALLAVSFPHGNVPVLHLFMIGLFTGTAGVAFLLFIHMTPIGLFIVSLEISAALNTNFASVLLFFTLGVGMFEEGCKSIALLIYLRGRPEIGWRQACLCGLATGVGFGVSEGIMYSAAVYNGVTDGLAYLTRFASCVTLHAVWSASAALTLYHSQALFHFMQEEGAKEEFYGDHVTDEIFAKLGSIVARYGIVVLRMICIVMVLHGLYNTALTVDMPLLAILVALVSFAYLAWQIEGCRRMEFDAQLAAETPAQPEA